jgi:hypothetical protein
MILDNEEQRQKLLSVISLVPINGPFGQIGPVMQDLGKLKEEVERAVALIPGWNVSVDKKE